MIQPFWQFAVGNLVSRAARPPVAVAPAVADPLLPLRNLGSGYPDEEGGLAWRSDGTYAVDFDLNPLAESSEAADAPTGWRDLALNLAGTPGLPPNAPERGTFAGRVGALKVYRPVYQDVVMSPGEDARITGGIYLPAASTATGVRVRVVDVASGRQYDAVAAAWDDDGTIAQQTTDDAWSDFAVDIDPEPGLSDRRTYRVIFEPIAAVFDATSPVYVSAQGGDGSPALLAAVDLVALIGNKLPKDAVVTLAPQPAGTAIPIPIRQPSSYAVAAAPQVARVWRLTIAIPAALRPSTPRPIIGEVWIGRALDLLVKSPAMQSPIDVSVKAAGQIRVEGGRGRIEVAPGADPVVDELQLRFNAIGDAAYQQARKGLAELCRFGVDPFLVLPNPAFEGTGRVYHVRMDDTISFSRVTLSDAADAATLRTFGMPLHESPLAGA